jgi:hypothetical protein
MKRQVPLGPDDMVCPAHKEKMSLVCHTCPKWVMVRGQDAQGNEHDNWNCSDAWMPLLLLEVSKQARQGGAATESFRNEMVRLATSRQRHQLALQGE